MCAQEARQLLALLDDLKILELIVTSLRYEGDVRCERCTVPVREKSSPATGLRFMRRK
jgi:hypothetical protein